MKALDARSVHSAAMTLRSTRMHQHLSGYLAIVRAIARSGSATNRDIVDFYDQFLRIPGAPTGKPYLQLFMDTKASDKTLWYQKNVRGSYSPSSLRNQGLRDALVNVSTPYQLRSEHWVTISEKLCKGKQISATSLAIFLFRDYGFDSPTKESLLDSFAAEFSYDRTTIEYNTLFEETTTSSDAITWQDVS